MWVAAGTFFVLILLQIDGFYGATYSILHPKLFRIDSDEAVVVNLHGYGRSDVSIYAVLTDYPSRSDLFSEVRTNGNAAEPIMFKMKVPRDKFADVETISNKKVEMEIHITFRSGGHSKIVSKKLVYLSGESDYIFVQTNRPIYKPGETVKIRAVPLHINMLPMRERGNTFEVVIKTAEGVAIWKKIRTFPLSNFVADEYEIPEGPPLGIYLVEAKLQSKTHTSTGSTQFKIDKYVLPTYHVKIDFKESTVRPGGQIRGSFKAEYSYGQPVVGTYAVVATLHIPEREPLEIYSKPQSHRKRPGMLRESHSGVATLNIPTRKATEVSNMTWSELIERKATVTVVVSVVGKAEGIMESDKVEGILITNTPYFIDMSHSSKYFIPSMTTFLNVIIRDVTTKEPVPRIHAVASIDGTSLDIRPRTDDRGYLQIPVETSSQDNQFHVTISTDDDQLDRSDQARTTFVLERHNSNAGYLRIEAPNVAEVGSDLYVRFRTRDFQPTTIYYLVLSRGGILLSGSVSANQQEVSHPIGITRKMSPSIRIVGYFMHGNDVVSDSVSIDVDDVCLSEELEITVEPEEIRPGEQVQISYQGEPQSILGTSAVDRAAYYLFEKGRLDRRKMFRMMESFDMGCSVSGGSTPLNVFEEAGLSFTSSTTSTVPMRTMDCPREADTQRRKRSLNDLVEDLDVERRIWIKKCHSDGRRESLVDERCGERKQRCERLEIDDKSLCIQAFYEGCILGESLRNSSEFRGSTARSSASGFLDPGSHPSNERRHIFSEGWLWYTLNLDGNGRESHSPPPPHSMTTYDIDAISLNNEEGFCIAKPAELKVFKDFFIQLYLPYSVKVMEQVQVRAVLFNYHPTKNREMRLRIRVDENLCTEGIPGEWSTVVERMTVKSQSSIPFIFSVIPLSVPSGHFAAIEMEAEPLTNDYLARDSIRRSLRVEPTGSEEEFSGSFQLDPSLSEPDRRITLNFPDDNIVPDSKSCSIFGYMSYLGPIIEFDPIADTPKNLDRSISLPGGCGEQNMKRVGPNVFAFKYLKYVGDPTPDTQAQVQKYIIDGYTRQQSHRNNGRWAIWSHAPPTIWINAYVDKVFLHSREVWPDMDISPICQSLRWIVQQQRQDGSFYEQAHSRHYWVNVAEGGEVALTAYVLITLLEEDPGCQDRALKNELTEVKSKAERYLRGSVGQIPYTAAIVTYALALADPYHASTANANQRLTQMQTQNGDETYWQGPNRARKHVPTWYRRQQAPIDIETTAYALLAQVAIARSQGSSVQSSFVERINGIARWMVSQQNDRGGFQSSQTTVIAIQSMTEYAKWIHSVNPPPRDPHLRMILSAPRTPWENGEAFSLDKNNEFYRKELSVPRAVMNVTRHIDVEVTGEGRGTLSYRCTYRTTRNSEVCDFTISATTERLGHFGEDGESEAAPGEGKEVIKLVLEISKITEGDSGMAIVDVSLISGFKPVESTLDAITISEALDGVLDKYEVTDQNVVLYVERIQHTESLRLGFKLQQTVSVKGASPAKIIVYDYYKPEDTCTKFYSLPDGSPHLRTSCAPTSIDSSSERMCKCMEGGCPTCRTREEQLDKTCGRRRRKCFGCTGDECLNLHHSVCNRNYGLIIEITEIDRESMPQFIKMTARVDEVIRRTSDNEIARDAHRTFMVRKDCFDKCTDISLKSLKESDYFAVGRVFLIRGKDGLSYPTSDGDSRIDYFLDKETIIERTLTAEKCARFEKRRQKCNRIDQSDNPKCISVREKLQLCDKQNAMREGVLEGCDV